ncbi:MAG: DUF1508 domain-containing protein, partial [Candidatus Bathyarchaeota archaeon]|nr:DUF1508 domain-containing protein [Candidatus Bathyarchaeota archaeon]
IGIDDALLKTAFGKAIEKSGMTVVKFFDMIIRWFIYLIAIFAAVEILEIKILSTYLMKVVEYLPSFIIGVLVLIFGLILVDWLADILKLIGTEAKMEFSGIFILGLRLFLYFMVLIIALTLMKIDVEILYVFAGALAWGAAVLVALGIGIAFVLGSKKTFTKNIPKWLKSVGESAQRMEKSTRRKSRFEVYKDSRGEFRFRLRAPNNEVIIIGESYKRKASCIKGINSVRKNASVAQIDDLTSSKK